MAINYDVNYNIKVNDFASQTIDRICGQAKALQDLATAFEKIKRQSEQLQKTLSSGMKLRIDTSTALKGLDDVARKARAVRSEMNGMGLATTPGAAGKGRGTTYTTTGTRNGWGNKAWDRSFIQQGSVKGGSSAPTGINRGNTAFSPIGGSKANPLGWSGSWDKNAAWPGQFKTPAQKITKQNNRTFTNAAMNPVYKNVAAGKVQSIPAPIGGATTTKQATVKAVKEQVKRASKVSSRPSNLSYKLLGPTPLPNSSGIAGDFVKGMGIAYGISGLTSIISDAISDAVSYDNTMTTVRNILGSNSKNPAFNSQFSQMQKTVRNVGIQTKYKVTEVADAAKFLAMAGYDAPSISRAITPISNIALIGDTDLGETADMMTNVMTAYNLTPSRVNKSADIMTRTFTRTNTTLTDIAEAYKYSASLLSAAGMSFEESTAGIGILGDAGIKGSQAGTSFRTILSNIINPRGKAKQAKWAATGIRRTNDDGSIRSLSEIFTELADKGYSVTDYYQLFDKTAAQAAVALAMHVDKWNDVIGDNFASAGLADQLAEAKKNTLEGLWNQLLSSFSDASLDGFGGIQEQIRVMLKTGVNYLQSDEGRGTINHVFETFWSFVETIKDSTGTLLKFFDTISPLVQTWLKFQITLWPLVKIMTSFQTAFFGLAAVFRTFFTAKTMFGNLRSIIGNRQLGAYMKDAGMNIVSGGASERYFSLRGVGGYYTKAGAEKYGGQGAVGGVNLPQGANKPLVKLPQLAQFPGSLTQGYTAFPSSKWKSWYGKNPNNWRVNRWAAEDVLNPFWYKSPLTLSPVQGGMTRLDNLKDFLLDGPASTRFWRMRDAGYAIDPYRLYYNPAQRVPQAPKGFWGRTWDKGKSAWGWVKNKGKATWNWNKRAGQRIGDSKFGTFAKGSSMLAGGAVGGAIGAELGNAMFEDSVIAQSIGGALGGALMMKLAPALLTNPLGWAALALGGGVALYKFKKNEDKKIDNIQKWRNNALSSYKNGYIDSIDWSRDDSVFRASMVATQKDLAGTNALLSQGVDYWEKWWKARKGGEEANNLPTIITGSLTGDSISELFANAKISEDSAWPWDKKVQSKTQDSIIKLFTDKAVGGVINGSHASIAGYNWDIGDDNGYSKMAAAIAGRYQGTDPNKANYNKFYADASNIAARMSETGTLTNFKNLKESAFANIPKADNNLLNVDNDWLTKNEGNWDVLAQHPIINKIIRRMIEYKFFSASSSAGIWQKIITENTNTGKVSHELVQKWINKSFDGNTIFNESQYGKIGTPEWVEKVISGFYDKNGQPIDKNIDKAIGQFNTLAQFYDNMPNELKPLFAPALNRSLMEALIPEGYRGGLELSGGLWFGDSNTGIGLDDNQQKTRKLFTAQDGSKYYGWVSKDGTPYFGDVRNTVGKPKKIGYKDWKNGVFKKMITPFLPQDAIATSSKASPNKKPALGKKSASAANDATAYYSSPYNATDSLTTSYGLAQYNPSDYAFAGNSAQRVTENNEMSVGCIYKVDNLNIYNTAEKPITAQSLQGLFTDSGKTIVQDFNQRKWV